MTTFRVTGEYVGDEGVLAQGVVTVTPSTLPLVGSDLMNDGVITDPIIAKVEDSRVDVELPASDSWEPDFSLNWAVKLNSGYTQSFNFMPRLSGVEVMLSAITPIPVPNLMATEAQYALDVLTARELAQEAAEVAVDARDDILSFQGAILPPLIHTQTTPAAQWIISHNRGWKPPIVVTLAEDPESPVFTDVTYPDLNTVIIELPAPSAGAAYIP